MGERRSWVRVGWNTGRSVVVVLLLVLVMGVLLLTAGCSDEEAQAPPPPPTAPPAPMGEQPPTTLPLPSPTTDSPAPVPTTAATGTLQVRANGEDFIRQGFVSKDGWSINFDHVYLTLADITAYQADPPYDAHTGGEVQAITTVRLAGPYTVDLAEGDENAAPVLVGEVEAPAGHYNALSWKMVRAAGGVAPGAVIMMEGTAAKDNETVTFRVALDQEQEHRCGDYVGDERKGLLSPGGVADLEATFHFDHLFGDAETPLDDPLNVGALGFGPLATLAQTGTLEVDQAALRTALAAEDNAKLENLHLAHVGEGHCFAVGH
jgi:hypothetical protein